MLSIIIVSWNVRDKLRENLTSLFKSETDFESCPAPFGQSDTENGECKKEISQLYERCGIEIFVVDNNSHDETAGMVKKEFPQVKLIANTENLGFAKANNQAIRQAKGEFILLLNPDMRVFPDTLKKMARWMQENKQAVVAGCHLIDERGKTIKHVRRFPTVWDQAAIVLKLPHLFPKILNNYLRVDFDYAKPAKTDSVRGGFFMIRREAIIPLLDERYFVWFEEVDFCRQIYKNGREVWYAPAAECVDYVGQSFKQLPRGQAQSYFRDSMLKYFKKWQPVWQYWILKMLWPIGLFLALMGEKLNFKSKTKT